MLYWIILCKLALVIFVMMRKIDCRAPVNVGTVLFDSSDCDKVCWMPSGELLLYARHLMQNMLPNELNRTFDKSYVSEFVDYVHSTVGIIRNTAQGQAQKALVLAVSDVIGGYMRVYLIPMVKHEYYNGDFPYSDMNRLYTLYEDIKSLLRTDGSGWSSPIVIKSDLSKLPSLRISKKNLSPDVCAHLIINKKNDRNSNSIIPLPYLDDDLSPHSIAVPFRKHSLRSLRAKSSKNLLTKYYVSGMKCLLSTASEEDFKNFNEEVERWLKKSVLPHLDDEQWYPAFYGVNRVLATVLRVRSVLRDNTPTTVDDVNLHDYRSSADIPSVTEAIHRDFQKVPEVLEERSGILSTMSKQRLSGSNAHKSDKNRVINDNGIPRRICNIPFSEYELNTDYVIGHSLKHNPVHDFWRTTAGTYPQKSQVSPIKDHVLIFAQEPSPLNFQNGSISSQSMHFLSLFSPPPTFSGITAPKFDVDVHDSPEDANARNILEENTLNSYRVSNHPNVHEYNAINVENNIVQTYKHATPKSFVYNGCSNNTLDSVSGVMKLNAAIKNENEISAESPPSTLRSDETPYLNMKLLNKLHVTEPNVVNNSIIFNPVKKPNSNKLQELQESILPTSKEYSPMSVSLNNVQTSVESLSPLISPPEVPFDYLSKTNFDKNMYQKINSLLDKPSEYLVIGTLNAGHVLTIPRIVPHVTVNSDFSKSFAAYSTPPTVIEYFPASATNINQPSSYLLKYLNDSSVMSQKSGHDSNSWNNLSVMSKNKKVHDAVTQPSAFVPVSGVSVSKRIPFLYIPHPNTKIPLRNNYESELPTEINYTVNTVKSNVFKNVNADLLHENKHSENLALNGKRDDVLSGPSNLEEKSNNISTMSRTAKRSIVDGDENISNHPNLSTFPLNSMNYNRNQPKNEENIHYAIFHNYSPDFLNIKIDNEYPIVSNVYRKKENSDRELSGLAINDITNTDDGGSFFKDKFLKYANANIFQKHIEGQNLRDTNDPMLDLSNFLLNSYQDSFNDIKNYRDIKSSFKSEDDDNFSEVVVDPMGSKVKFSPDVIGNNSSNQEIRKHIRNDFVDKNQVVHNETSYLYNDRNLGKETLGESDENISKEAAVKVKRVDHANEKERVHKTYYNRFDNELNKSSQLSNFHPSEKENGFDSLHSQQSEGHRNENKNSLNSIEQSLNNQPNSDLHGTTNYGGFMKKMKSNELKTKPILKTQQIGRGSWDLNDKDEYKEEDDDEDYSVENYKKSKGIEGANSHKKLKVRRDGSNSESGDAMMQSGMCWFMFDIVQQVVCSLIISPDLAITNFVISVLFWFVLWFSYFVLTGRSCPCIDFDEEPCICYEQGDMKCLSLGQDYYMVQCGCGAQSFLKTTIGTPGSRSEQELTEGESVGRKCASLTRFPKRTTWKSDRSNSSGKSGTGRETISRSSLREPQSRKSILSKSSRESVKSRRSSVTITNEKKESRACTCITPRKSQRRTIKSDDLLQLTRKKSDVPQLEECPTVLQVEQMTTQEPRVVNVNDNGNMSSTPTATVRSSCPSRTTDTSRGTSKTFLGDPTESSDVTRTSARMNDIMGQVQSEKGSRKSNRLTERAEKGDMGGPNIPSTTLVCSCGKDDDVVRQVEAALQVIRMANYVADSPQKSPGAMIESFPLRKGLSAIPQLFSNQRGTRRCPGEGRNLGESTPRFLTLSSFGQGRSWKGSENTPSSSQQASSPRSVSSDRQAKDGVKKRQRDGLDTESVEVEVKSELLAPESFVDDNTAKSRLTHDDFGSGSSVSYLSDLIENVKEEMLESSAESSRRTTLSRSSMSARTEQTSQYSRAPTVKRRKSPH